MDKEKDGFCRYKSISKGGWWNCNLWEWSPGGLWYHQEPEINLFGSPVSCIHYFSNRTTMHMLTRQPTHPQIPYKHLGYSKNPGWLVSRIHDQIILLTAVRKLTEKGLWRDGGNWWFWISPTAGHTPSKDLALPLLQGSVLPWRSCVNDFIGIARGLWLVAAWINGQHFSQPALSVVPAFEFSLAEYKSF